MKLLGQGLSLALLAAGIAAVPAASVQAQPAGPDDVVSQLRQEANTSVSVRRSPATGKVTFLTANGRTGDLLPGIAATTGKDAVAKAGEYVDRYAAAFGARADELQQSRVTTDGNGTTVTYQQVYRGIPVYAGELKVSVDSQGDLVGVAGNAVPDLDLSVTPRASADKAGAQAVRWVKADPPSHDEGDGTTDLSGIKADPQLVVYRKGLVKGEPGEAVLAYQVEVSNGKNIRDIVVLDAQTLKIINRYSLVHGALDRELYELNPGTTPVWSEGDAFPGGLNEDQQNLVNSAGESYWLYSNAFGRDSYDGAGATMKTVNNDPTIACPNANWNGTTTNYCDGVTSDDVVSHEWGHAYTEYTSGLIYQYQSGALNESYSDVWGETLDQINGREDEGEEFTTPRPEGCEVTAPAGITMNITAPATRECTAVEAGFGPGFTTTPTTATVLVATDAANVTGPSTTDGCTAFTNAGAISGKYAYVDRGTCSFQVKVDNAVAAGATGIVIGNNNVDFPISPAGTATIPGVMVGQDDGVVFKANGTSTVSIAAEDTSARADSTRWLMGEKSTAFGGAIRDMWSPTCYGDPAKVTDAEYKCDPALTDAGGVHSNSGVPNHAYALTVDGGTFNGQTISGIGLDKAANIWWRAQSAYLTPASNFTDAADAFEQSCADLVGQPINELSTTPNAGQVATTPITADDCAQLTKAVAAVEMRTEPVRCDFQPLLAKNAPNPCGEGFVSDAIWSEDFEDGLAGWTASQELTDLPDEGYAGGFGKPWESVAKAPEGHATKVAYGPTPDLGDCSGDGVNDFSSRDSITSPIVELPDTLRAPRLTFDHYVAIEGGYDGGNVKVSINGGSFETIPAESYVFNAPGEIFSLGEGNTNPLEGQDGFTGVDGGQAKGSWGQSQVDIGSLGIEPGDTVQFRFDIGRDGCGGIDGWYVDNVQLIQCKLGTEMTAVHLPEPSTFGEASAVQVKVSRKGNVGSAPTGDVTLTKADGSTVASGTLDGGAATIALPTDLPVGVHTLTATYSGNATLASATAKVTVTVKAAPGEEKAGSRTSAAVKPAKPSFRQDFKVVTKVKSRDGKPTGKVVVRIDDKLVGTAKIRKGRVVLKVTKDLKVGKHKLVAIYQGSDTVERSKDKLTFRVVR